MKFISYLFMGIFLMGCTAPKLDVFEIDTFQNQPPIQIKVKRIEILNQVENFDKLPHIENEMPRSPKSVLQEWAKNRFYPLDSAKIDEMRVVIEKAYMTRKDEKSENWYTLDNEVYKLTYAIRIDFLSQGKVVYTQDVGGFESSSLPKRSSLNDKENVFEKMMNTMIQKVNQQVLTQMPPKMIVGGY